MKIYFAAALLIASLPNILLVLSITIALLLDSFNHQLTLIIAVIEDDGLCPDECRYLFVFFNISTCEIVNMYKFRCLADAVNYYVIDFKSYCVLVKMLNKIKFMHVMFDKKKSLFLFSLCLPLMIILAPAN